MPLIHANTALPLETGKSLFDYADDLALRVPTSCGRTGECHECIVEVRRGMDALETSTEAENFLRENYRLACQAIVRDVEADIEFNILRRQPRILTESIERSDIELDPTAVREGDEIVYKGPGGPRVIDRYRGRMLGLAADIGTTTVAMNLVDLENGDVLYTASFENPQRFGGSDVMHRISYDTGVFQGELQAVLISSINYEIGEMVRALRIRRRHIVDFVAVGNTTMRDLLFGVDVEPIGVKPYKSHIESELLDGKRDTTALSAPAHELGIRINPNANVYGGPLIASHIGSDVAADLLTVAIDETDEMVMLVDIGTNTEIVAGNRESLFAASCPAGPAFEGGAVAYAMPGYDGAVERVSIQDSDAEDIELTTIGEMEPSGICGSGLIDLLAELRRHDIMNELGAFNDGSGEFTFHAENGLTLSRADISALAQAKAANYCGQNIVIETVGTAPNDYARLFLAGGFANYINIENAIDIGFIPDMPISRIAKIGNASLQGATIMLTNAAKRAAIEELTKSINHIELETNPNFFDHFVEGCQFKK